jgi:hypothetical protein
MVNPQLASQPKSYWRRFAQLCRRHFSLVLPFLCWANLHTGLDAGRHHGLPRTGAIEVADFMLLTEHFL